MKKIITSVVLFIVGFAVTYLIMCYLIPGLRIKLFAESMEYFIESVRHMAGFKIIVSSVVGLLVGGLPLMLNKRGK